jgi:endo-1,4-beta-mannosidase
MPTMKLRPTSRIVISLVVCFWQLSSEAAETQATSKDVLSIKKGRFFLDGQPFAEISFNKYDLLWPMYDELAAGRLLSATNPAVRAENKALSDLHDLGFKTIRVFALPWGPAGPEAYADAGKRKGLYAALDKMVELCEAHEIRIVWSLSAGSFTDTKLDPANGWIYGEEQERELVANRNSRGRQLLYHYIDETVERYRRRKAVLMWEISNEVTLQADIGDSKHVYNHERMPTLKEVAEFFDDVSKRIKSADPLRLINSGGSNMRESQWHLYSVTNWQRDSFEEQFKCFELLYGHSAVDVIDIHSYPDNKSGYAILGEEGKPLWLDNKGYIRIAARLRKPLMIGELGLHAFAKTNTNIWTETPKYFETYDDVTAAMPWVMKTLNDVIEAEVPLSYWWCYQSEDIGERSNRQHFDIDRNRHPELVACIADANRRLKAKLLGVK